MMGLLSLLQEALIMFNPTVVVLAICFVYIFALTIYRLCISPLAKFPGPKLTAATGWYETYYQLFKGRGGGQFIFKIAEWHKQYGPIVRINPTELHISDPDFYESIYSHGQGIDKPSYMKWQLGTPGTMFAATGADLHRVRRSALNPFFSKRKVLELAPKITRQVEKACSRLEREYDGTGKVLRVDYMFACISTDTVTDYAIDRSYNFVDAPDFMSPFTISMDSFKKASQVSAQFPWIPRLMASLPESLVAAINPVVIPSFQFRKEMVEQIKGIRQAGSERKDEKSHGTVFTEIMDAKLRPSEMVTERLADEAAGVVGAAIETTRWALSVIFFYVLSNRQILERLERELKEAIPDPSNLPSISQLEKLPYLMGVIEEGLRLSYGTVSRSPRIHRLRPLQYGKYIIPIGTPVSTSTYIMHHNEEVFPSSREFNPSRWLNDAKGPDGKKPLSRYLTSFTKGTRMCLGMQLAYANMELVLAALFSRFDFELFETTQRDVICIGDLTGVGVWEGSQGIRVMVNSKKKVPA